MSFPPNIEVPVTLRDFRAGHFLRQRPDAAVPDPKGHPDFQYPPGTQFDATLDLGIVYHEIDILDGRLPVEQRDINNRKPRYVGGKRPLEQRSTNGKDFFDQWYQDVAGINTSVPFFLNFELDGSLYKFGPDPRNSTKLWGSNGLQKKADGSFLGFFPLDNLATEPDGDPIRLYPAKDGSLHNFHFTMEMHHKFTYRRDDNWIFRFVGDDDLWVFIDGKLVVDLGGLHKAMEREIKLNQLQWLHPDGPQAIELQDGEDYHFDLFYAERHSTESNCYIETSIRFNPKVGISAIKKYAQEPTSFRLATSGVFVVERDKQIFAPLEVAYRVGGTASRNHYELRYDSETGPLLGDTIVLPVDEEKRSLQIFVVPTSADANFDDDDVEITLLEGDRYDVLPDKQSDTVIIGDYVPPQIGVYHQKDAREPQPARPAIDGEFQITLDKRPQEQLQVGYALGGSARPEDYTLTYADGRRVGNVLVIEAGVRQLVLLVKPRVDANVRDDTVVLRLSPSPDNRYTLGDNPASLTIIDHKPPTLPTVTIEGTRDAREPERGQPVTDENRGLFTVYLTRPASEDLVVKFDVVSGRPNAATEGTDYRRLSRSVVVRRGTQSAEIPVIASPDNIREGTETVTLLLEANRGYLLPTTQEGRSATINIRDQFVPPPRFPIVTIRRTRDAIEPDPGQEALPRQMGQFTVRMQNPPERGSVTVNLMVVENPGDAEEGVDYKPLPRAVVLNQARSEMVISVEPKADPIRARVHEGPEDVTLALLASPNYRLHPTGQLSSATIRIVDKEVPPPPPPPPLLPVIEVRAEDPRAVEPDAKYGTLGTDIGIFAIEVTENPSDKPITVGYGISGNAEYNTDYILQHEDGSRVGRERRGNLIHIPANQTRVRIHVIPKADLDATNADREEQVVLTLERSSDRSYELGDRKSDTVTIVDITAGKPH